MCKIDNATAGGGTSVRDGAMQGIWNCEGDHLITSHRK